MEAALKTHTKTEVKNFLKAVERRFPAWEIKSYRKKLQVEVREGNVVMLYDYSDDRNELVRVCEVKEDE